MRRLLAIGVVGLLAGSGCATLTEVSQAGGPNTAGSSYRKAANSGPEISGDGRYSVFVGPRSATDSTAEVYRRDNRTGTTVRVSSDATGAPVGGNAAAISRDGRYVAFRTTAALVAGDTNRDVTKFQNGDDVYVRDMNAAASYDLVTYDEHGVQLVPSGPNGLDSSVFISASGRYVAFQFKLSAGRTFGGSIYIRDRQAAATTVVGGGYAQLAGLSGDGLHVGIDDYTACVTSCPVYAGGHVNDWTAGTSVQIGCESGGSLAMSDDGRYIATWQSGRLAGCTAGVARYDRQHLTTPVMVTPTLPPNPFASSGVASSADGTRVAFDTVAPLVPADTNTVADVYVRDVASGDLSLASQGPLNQAGDGLSYTSDLSADGAYVQFDTDATNLLPDDTDGATDTVVTPALRPVMVSVLPPSIARGTSHSITISAHPLASGATVAVLGGGVTVGPVSVLNGVAAMTTVTVAANATPGPRDLVITNPGAYGVASAWCFGCLAVT
jgi:hypothetical protein